MHDGWIEWVHLFKKMEKIQFYGQTIFKLFYFYLFFSIMLSKDENKE